ncbi:uncharacterized protein DC041_0011901 [Schistosoma bovis]|uniref:Uncharacterized protein n=1 Tax=Schistosoma bovis TaxID=6184 RepID=A0A430QC85_SCHBO|nr:uncharacterized protein DC041_0011901 [Schistosoma bovis]
MVDIPLTSDSIATVRLRLLTSTGSIISSSDFSLLTHKEATRTAFNLMTSHGSPNNSNQDHGLLAPFWLSTLRVYVLQTPVSFSRYNMPGEIVRRIQLSSKGYLPVIYVNPNFQASSDWLEVNQPPENRRLEMVLSIEPLSIGHLRLRCMLEAVADQLLSYGRLFHN